MRSANATSVLLCCLARQLVLNTGPLDREDSSMPAILPSSQILCCEHRRSMRVLLLLPLLPLLLIQNLPLFIFYCESHLGSLDIDIMLEKDNSISVQLPGTGTINFYPVIPVPLTDRVKIRRKTT